MNDKKPISSIEQITIPILVTVNLVICFIISQFKFESKIYYSILFLTSLVLAILVHKELTLKLATRLILGFANASIIFTSTIGSAQIGKQASSTVASWINQNQLKEVYGSNNNPSFFNNNLYFAQITTTQEIIKTKEDLEKYSEILKFLKKNPEYIGKIVHSQSSQESPHREQSSSRELLQNEDEKKKEKH